MITDQFHGVNIISNDKCTGTMQEHLLGAMQRILPRRIRIATAYLTPDGFMALKDGMAGAETVQLLLGERPFLNRRGPEDTLVQPGDAEELAGPAEAVDWHTFLESGYPWLLLTRQERAELLARGDDPLREVFDLSAWERVRALISFLQREGVQARRYLGQDAGKIAPDKVLDYRKSRARLHAKAYLFAGELGDYAAVGSTNLTRSGLSGNVELNLATFDPGLTRSLEEWFDAKWQEGQDCKEEFIKRLEECVLFGRRYTPWQVFLKSLHAAYGRFLELGLSSEVVERLADFQQHAVQRCVTLLERHWGVMLCDSVGLGKTYEGLGILAEFTKRRGKARALVVCPAQLEGNWNPERLFEWGIAGETVSMESLRRLADLHEVTDADERRALQRRLRRYQDNFDVILVDEAHNFRRPATDQYKALMEIIRGGKPDKRVVLLTATPVNNSILDLYHQLSLITRGDDTWYAGRGPVANLRTTFQALEKGEGGAGLLDAMLLSMVRRTRHDIRAMQEAGMEMQVGGQELRFPQHEIPQAVNYRLQKLYGNIYHDIIDAIENLNFAVYQLESYGVDTGQQASADTLRARNTSFVGIMRTILLKRMESSASAFTGTVRDMVAYLNLFLARLGEGRVLTPKQAYRLRAVLGGSLPDQDLEVEDWDARALETLREFRPAPEDKNQQERLRQAVTEDRNRLQGLLDRLKWLEALWEKAADPKVAALRELLESLPPHDQHGVPTKVVVFTNYKDTAEHIFQQLGGNLEDLKRDFRLQSNLNDRRWMGLLTGKDDRRRRATVLEHFTPLAAHRDGEALEDPELLRRIRPFREKSIELLIATDVLSEGQNLQDAQFLVNYDLPWNPVRMIQRAGRIDRLFSPHERVFIYNIMPEQELEDLLKLVKNLSRKLETIEDAVALDASVLGEQIEARQLDKILALRAGGARAEEVYREGERNQGLDAGMEILNKYLEIMKQYATEEVQAIPNGVYSVREGARAGVYIMLKMPEDMSGEVFWRFYPLGDTARPLTSPNEVLDLIAAPPEALRLELPDEVNPFRFLQEPLQAAVNQVGEAYLQAVSAYAPDEFARKLRLILQRDDILAADEALWEKLHQWTQQPQPSDALRRPAMVGPVRAINQVRRNARSADIVELLRELWAAIETEGLDRQLQKPDSFQPSVKDLELVAWELVVGKEQIAGLGKA